MSSQSWLWRPRFVFMLLMMILFFGKFVYSQTEETLSESLMKKRFVHYKSKPLIGYLETVGLYGPSSSLFSKVDSNIIYFTTGVANLGQLHKLVKFNISSGEISTFTELPNIFSRFQVSSFKSSNQKEFDLIYFYSYPRCYLKRYNTADGTISNLAGNGVCASWISNATQSANTISLYPSNIVVPNVNYSTLDEIEVYLSQETNVYLIKNGTVSLYRTISSNSYGFFINQYGDWNVLTHSNFQRIYRNGSVEILDCIGCISYDQTSISYQQGEQTILEETLYFSGYLFVKKKTFTTFYNQDGEVDSIQVGNFSYFIRGVNMGSLGDGGLAIEAQMAFGVSLSVSLDGNIAFNDVTSNVRMINTKTGLIFTIFSYDTAIVDKSRATLTGLRSPKGLTLFKNKKGEEELLIADSDSGRLMKYSFASGISERVDAPLLDMKRGNYQKVPIFSNPLSITVDNQSNLLIVNDNSYWISSFLVKYNTLTQDSQPLTRNGFFNLTGQQGTFEGLSTVLNQPQGVCIAEIPFGIYKNLTLFISDTNNYRVIMLDLSTGIAQTLVSKSDGIGTPVGIAYYSKYVFFADSEKHCIWRMHIQKRKLELFAGIPKLNGFNGDGLALNVTFNSPKGIYIDDAEEMLVIADSKNHRIRSINLLESPPMVSTICGTGQDGFNGDDLKCRESQLNTPEDVVLIGKSLCISDTNNQRIRIMRDDQSLITFAGNGEIGNEGDGGYVRNLKLYSPKSSAVSGTYLFISDTNNNRILKVHLLSGTAERIIGGGDNEEGLGISTKLSYPSSIRYYLRGKEQYMAIADTYNNLVKVYNVNTGIVKTVVGGIGDNGQSSVASIKPYAVAVSSSDEIYLTDVENNKIRKIDRNGIITTIAGKGYGFNGDSNDAKSVLLASPSGIAITPHNEIIFSDRNNNRIRMIHVNGSISTIAGTGAPGFKDGIASQAELNSPTMLKLVPPDYIDIIFIDSLNRKVRKISRRNGIEIVYTIAGNSTVKGLDLNENLGLNDYLPSTQDLAQSERSGLIYLSDANQNVVRQLTPYCQEGYTLNSDFTICIPICYGIPSNVSLLVCNGNGKCIDTNQCTCSEKFTGDRCHIPVCFNYANSSIEVCSYGNGTCLSPDNCICNSGYLGKDCGIAICFGESKLNACSGHGSCTKHDTCLCNSGYMGNDCSINVIAMGLGIASGIIFVFVLITCVIVVYTISLKRKHKRLTNTDLILDERLLDHYESSMGSSSSYKDVDSDKFIIPIEQLNMDKPIKRLGEGGMGSVFSTKFNGMIIAVKVFDLNNLSISENDFKVEAILLSKLRHPNIINFYGVSSSATKRFIAMECMDKSLESIIASLQKGYSKCRLEEKLAILRNIVSGIYYLHHLEPDYIVHRDLKPANILLDKNGVAKLCDFGLGRALSSHTQSAITTQIGTSSFMAPELFSGEIERFDARSIDIYSLAIIIWQLLFEIIDPYHSSDPKVLQKLKLSKPLQFTSAYYFHKSICEDGLRPIIPFNTLSECKEWCDEFLLPNDIEYYQLVYEISILIRQSWSNEPGKRPSIDWIMQKMEDWNTLFTEN